MAIEAAMTGAEMKAIRKRLGLSTTQLGRAFGYMGRDNTASVLIRTYESDGRPIPLYLERLLILYEKHGIPPGWTELRAAKAAEK